MNRLMLIFQALFLGAKLKKSSTWKTWGAYIAVFAPLLASLSKLAYGYGWLPAELSEEEVNSIAAWVWQGSGILLAYWFQATSSDVGIGKVQEIGYQVLPLEGEPEDVDESVGVLYAVPGLRVQSRDTASRHPGEDPSLDDFN